MAFDLLKIGLFKFPPFWAKIVFKCPTQVPDFMVYLCRRQNQQSLLSTHTPRFKTLIMIEHFTHGHELFSFQNLYIKRLKHMYSARKTWQLVQVSHPPRHQVQISKVQIPHHQGIDYTQTPWVVPRGRGMLRLKIDWRITHEEKY